MQTDRQLLASWWASAWSEGLWAAPWPKALEGLTPEQAAWQPRGPGDERRHSIWQHVLHMLFWREDALRRLTDAVPPTKELVASLNFPEVADVSQPAWDATIARFKASHDRIARCFDSPDAGISRLAYMLPHDCYHFGQINLIRALMGFKPIE